MAESGLTFAVSERTLAIDRLVDRETERRKREIGCLSVSEGEGRGCLRYIWGGWITITPLCPFMVYNGLAMLAK